MQYKPTTSIMEYTPNTSTQLQETQLSMKGTENVYNTQRGEECSAYHAVTDLLFKFLTLDKDLQ